jgi:hypothetical protein
MSVGTSRERATNAKLVFKGKLPGKAAMGYGERGPSPNVIVFESIGENAVRVRCPYLEFV